MYLVIRLNLFSYWMMGHSKIYKGGQKRVLYSPDVMSKMIGSVCILFKGGKYFTNLNLLKDCKYET